MAGRRPFMPEDILRLKTVSDPQISPDGSRIAYTLTFVDGEKDEYRSHIYVVPTTGGPAIRWTNGPKRDAQPRWSPDGKYLAFVREVPDQRPQIYLMRSDGGEAWKLTNLPKGAGNPVWSPDSKQIAFVAATGGEEKEEKEKTEIEKHRPRVIEHLNYKFDGTGYFDGRRSHIFVISVVGSDAQRLPEPRQLTDGDWDDQYPCWSPDGRQIAFLSYREPDRHEVLWLNDVWVIAAEGGEPRKLTRSRGPANLPVWSPDGAWIAYSGHEYGMAGAARTVHLNVIPAGGGEPRVLTAALDRHVVGPVAPPAPVFAWSPDSRGLYFIAMDHGNMPVFFVDLDGNVRPVISGERQVTGLTLTPDGTRLAFTAWHSNSPGDVYTALNDGREERQLTAVNHEVLAEIDLGRTEHIHYKGADDWEIEGWVLLPPDFREGQRYPAVLEVHGGPHSQYGNAFQPGFHALAGAGYLVVYLNPRGSTGYGEAFCLACVNDWGGKDFTDLLLGLDHVVGLGWADPDRLGNTGYSYGGFMTAWAIGHSDRFKAAVAGGCVSNAYSIWGTSDIGPQFMQYEFGDTLPHEQPTRYLERSPVQYLAKCTTPLLLLHHDGDLRCPIAQSEEVFAVLKKLGKEVVMVRYPGGFHTYLTHAPSQRVDAIQRTIAWFDRHLQAASETKRATMTAGDGEAA